MCLIVILFVLSASRLLIFLCVVVCGLWDGLAIDMECSESVTMRVLWSLCVA